MNGKCRVLKWSFDVDGQWLKITRVDKEGSEETLLRHDSIEVISVDIDEPDKGVGELVIYTSRGNYFGFYDDYDYLLAVQDLIKDLIS